MKALVSKLRAAAGAATLLAFASPLAAQRPLGPPEPGLRGGLAARLAAHPDALGLNDEQTARLRRVGQWVEQSDSSLRGQIRAVFAGKRPVDLTAEERYQAMKRIEPLADQLRANRRAVLDSVHAILTPDQFQRVGQRAMALQAWGRGYARGWARGRFGLRRGPGAPGWGPGSGGGGGSWRWPL